MTCTTRLMHSLAIAGFTPLLLSCQAKETPRPNVVYVFADEWRAQDLGFNGNTDVQTPNLDRLAGESIRFTNAISGCPVCSPYRGSLLTGQYPLTHGVFVNDVLLNPEARTLPKIFRDAGYETAYIGKWHLDGHGRSAFIPRERRQGFDYWKVLECTHDYNNSWYWDNDDQKKKWEGYDAIAQTKDAISYINTRKSSGKPFLLMLSWGPPHTPFQTAPENYREIYRDKDLAVRPNVPEHLREEAIFHLKGYYAHITALDQCIGDLQAAIKNAGLEDNTIFIFTSDHGYMIHSQGWFHKQVPFEESVHIPFLLKYPARFGRQGTTNSMMLNTPDIMPTLAGLCNIPVPAEAEGSDLSKIVTGEQPDNTDAVLLACYHPFGQWPRKDGGVEYRGVRTKKYTYACKLDGPWLLYDNLADPFQLNNLVDKEEYRVVREELHVKMEEMLNRTADTFEPGMNYIRKWNYVVDETETVPYRKINFRGEPVGD